MRRAELLAVIASVSILSSCASDDPDETGPGEPPALAGRCTGPVPANASSCPGAEDGVLADMARFVVGPAGSCSVERCAYACHPGFAFVAGACVLDAPPDETPSFVDHGDGTVTDALTGLVWLKRPGCADPLAGFAPSPDGLAWPDASGWVAHLGSGACELADGSTAGDWRLPDDLELTVLALHLAGAANQPFTDWSGTYWSRTRPCSGQALAVAFPGGAPEKIYEDQLREVWAVR